MSREQTYKAIILKKSPFLEADEIITALTFEMGKVRFLAKSVKLAKSKLQNSLQSLFLCEVRVANSRSSKLQKIIGAEPQITFSEMRENLYAVKSAFSAAELVLKFLPDEQPHPGVFNLLKIFLSYLSESLLLESECEIGLLAFKIKFLDGIGLGIRYPEKADENNLYFENHSGGFVTSSHVGVKVGHGSLKYFLDLKDASFKDLPKALPEIKELTGVINQFLEYQLERELKAEKSLSDVV